MINYTGHMKKRKYLTLIFFTISILTFGQAKDLKEAALKAFSEENYPKAIEFLKAALNESPEDAEIYYYLGYFTHYNAYDSRPLAGYDSSYSNIVFDYLDKALELNPNYGDAKYFYTAECGAAAHRAFASGNFKAVKGFYEKAYIRGGFPEWAIEYGRILLDLCEPNAILFTHGDFVLNVCWYLQLCESYRTDISIIPLVLLDRPNYVLKVKDGGLMEAVSMKISDEQIMDMHPYKWDTLSILIDIPEKLINKYKLSKDCKMNWEVTPDLVSNRVLSDIASKNQERRTYLSGYRAILLNIIETNQWKRPIFFSAFDPFYLAGLDEYLQRSILVSKLLPIKTKGTEWEYNFNQLEEFVFNASLKDFKSVLSTNQPRVSGILSSYYFPYLILAANFKKQDNIEMLDKVITAFQEKVMIGFNTENETRYLEYLKNLKK